ncbi:NAD(P)/FAD-dependent oxidoreductase [Hydrogenimonas sp.]
MRVAIVGGGAAGMMAAIHAARKGVHIDLYESEKEPGRKILASGNGRCNVSNTSLDVSDYFGHDTSFVAPALKRFGYGDLERFFLKLGVVFKSLPDGRAYPLSDEAGTIQAALVREVHRLGVGVRCDAPVERIDRSGVSFVVTTPGGAGRYDRVLLACGSPAAPQLGGSTGGLALAASLGHRIVDPYPALVGLHLPGSLHERLAGLKIASRLTLYIDGKAKERVEGDLLFTRYGVSGFAVLDISTQASWALTHKRSVTLGISLLPDYDRQGIAALLTRLAKTAPHLSLEALLHGLLPRKLVKALLNYLRLPAERVVAEVDTKAMRKLAATMADWRFSVMGTHGYRHAEAAGGGVATEEVDAKTMASKKVPGLYFAGEVLDVVGRRGGYNFHWAWASGKAAGEAIAAT